MNDEKLTELVQRVLVELEASGGLGLLEDEKPPAQPAGSGLTTSIGGPDSSCFEPVDPAKAALAAQAARTGIVVGDGRLTPAEYGIIEDGEVDDIRGVDYRTVYNVPNAVNPDEFKRLKMGTAARLGLGRSGPRYSTFALLRFWADNAAAMDAVFSDVDPKLLEDLGLFSVQTKCQTKDEYLTRPDLGAQFDDDTIAEIKKRCTPNPQVQIVVADGLSSTAVEANVRDLLPSLEQGLKLQGLSVGTPFFVKYGRVRAMEPISEALGAQVTCIFVGERPGLVTPESLSAYIAFRAKTGMSESFRTCVSNIHKDGTNAAEAGAHIADLIAEMIYQQASGVNLKV